MRKKLNITEGIFPMPVLMVATYNEDGSINVMNAAWGTMQERDRVALNLTETHKTVKNIKARGAFTVSIADAAFAWMRLHGKAVFEDNMEVKEACMGNPIVKGQYGTAENPIFTVFYLEQPHGVIADFSGNPPYEF